MSEFFIKIKLCIFLKINDVFPISHTSRLKSSCAFKTEILYHTHIVIFATLWRHINQNRKCNCCRPFECCSLAHHHPCCSGIFARMPPLASYKCHCTHAAGRLIVVLISSAGAIFTHALPVRCGSDGKDELLHECVLWSRCTCRQLHVRVCRNANCGLIEINRYHLGW